MFWATEGEIISNILGGNIQIDFHAYLAFLFGWYFFTIITYGTNVPSGLFLPGMILGCILGEITTSLAIQIGYIAEETRAVTLKNFVVLGNASMLAGYTRMTYSLAVIIMETS